MLEPTMLLLAITKLSDDAPACTKLPPDVTLPATPTPPNTMRAPVPVLVLVLELLMVKFWANVLLPNSVSVKAAAGTVEPVLMVTVDADTA
jgi:hypothetical protein